MVRRCARFRALVGNMISWLMTFWRRHARGAVALVVLFVVCVRIVPIPLAPTTGPEKDRSAPFPCQSRPCGCRSAEQCWKKCCCFTNAQKLAWAEANSVQLPEYVVAAAKKEQPSRTCETGGCCHNPTNSIVADDKTQPMATATPKLSCCAKPSQLPKPASKALAEKRSDVVIIALAEECQGHSSLWNSLPWSVLPDPMIPPAFLANDSEQFLPISEVAVQLHDRPPVPPPRPVSDIL